MSVVVPRAALAAVRQSLRRSPVVTLVGARQCGKTTLARQLVSPSSANYFDLEDPLSLQRLDEPMTALGRLQGLVVVDEVQRRPELFPVLRVLADREGQPARFLVLGSAGPELLRQSSESLAGRIEILELSGFQVQEVGCGALETLWLRGGFPRSFLAASDEDSFRWREHYLRALTERDLPGFGARLPPGTLRRLLLMLAAYHGQIVNLAAIASSIGLPESTIRRYLDLMERLFVIRQLRPWHQNLRKRQVKRPKLYFRDSGVVHQLMGLGTRDALLRDPRLGASWEGFLIEKVLVEAASPDAWFWRTHSGAELDLLLRIGGLRIGVEIKWADAPRRTRSMRVALDDLALDRLFVVYPGELRFDIDDRITALPASGRFAVEGGPRLDGGAAEPR